MILGGIYDGNQAVHLIWTIWIQWKISQTRFLTKSNSNAFVTRYIQIPIQFVAHVQYVFFYFATIM